MKKIFIIPVTILLALAFFAFGINSFTKKTETMSQNKIKLIAPEKTGGMPLMEALNKRHSSRNISSKKITDQELSNLLWAAFGISRDESGKRTAPTANDTRAMDIYVIMENGTYKYSAEDHSLDRVTEKDLRNFAGKQDFVYTAPVNLVYVADYSKLKEGSDKEVYSGAHAGFIGENVYLYCISAGLGTVVRAWVDKDSLAKELGLKETQKIILAQTVGYTE